MTLISMIMIMILRRRRRRRRRERKQNLESALPLNPTSTRNHSGRLSSNIEKKKLEDVPNPLLTYLLTYRAYPPGTLFMTFRWSLDLALTQKTSWLQM
jgi:hypothetical protein